VNEQLAVIFDVDGVLVDSYAAHLESWRALARERGCHEMTEQEFRATFGRTSREIIAELWVEPSAEQVRALDDRKEQLFREMLQADFRAMPGVGQLIDSLLAAGFVIAAGSSGPPDNVLLVLDQLERKDSFAAVVTGLDVQRGKPEPEVFLCCAGRLGVPAANCAVIEDAQVGIQAANRAGMLSIGLAAPPRTVSELGAAEHVVESHSELTPAVIAQWITARKLSDR
jgi:beta-phosphoglucomutase